MNFLHITVLLSCFIISALAAELYYAVPIQQYVAGSEYDPYGNPEENEVFVPNESSNSQYRTALSEDDSDESNSESNSDGSSESDEESEFKSDGNRDDEREFLQPAEARNYYYRPYIRYRQISRRQTRVPSRRRYDLSGYISQRDRFPTVA